MHKCYLGSECHELGMVLLVEVVEGLHVLAVGDGPVDGGEVFTLGKLLVQTPEHLQLEYHEQRLKVSLNEMNFRAKMLHIDNLGKNFFFSIQLETV